MFLDEEEIWNLYLKNGFGLNGLSITNSTHLNIVLKRIHFEITSELNKDLMKSISSLEEKILLDNNKSFKGITLDIKQTISEDFEATKNKLNQSVKTLKSEIAKNIKDTQHLSSNVENLNSDNSSFKDIVNNTIKNFETSVSKDLEHTKKDLKFNIDKINSIVETDIKNLDSDIKYYVDNKHSDLENAINKFDSDIANVKNQIKSLSERMYNTGSVPSPSIASAPPSSTPSNDIRLSKLEDELNNLRDFIMYVFSEFYKFSVKTSQDMLILRSLFSMGLNSGAFLLPGEDLKSLIIDTTNVDSIYGNYRGYASIDISVSGYLGKSYSNIVNLENIIAPNGVELSFHFEYMPNDEYNDLSKFQSTYFYYNNRVIETFTKHLTFKRVSGKWQLKEFYKNIFLGYQNIDNPVVVAGNPTNIKHSFYIVKSSDGNCIVKSSNITPTLFYDQASDTFTIHLPIKFKYTDNNFNFTLVHRDNTSTQVYNNQAIALVKTHDTISFKLDKVIGPDMFFDFEIKGPVEENIIPNYIPAINLQLPFIDNPEIKNILDFENSANNIKLELRKTEDKLKDLETNLTTFINQVSLDIQDMTREFREKHDFQDVEISIISEIDSKLNPLDVSTYLSTLPDKFKTNSAINTFARAKVDSLNLLQHINLIQGSIDIPDFNTRMLSVDATTKSHPLFIKVSDDVKAILELKETEDKIKKAIASLEATNNYIELDKVFHVLPQDMQTNPLVLAKYGMLQQAHLNNAIVFVNNEADKLTDINTFDNDVANIYIQTNVPQPVIDGSIIPSIVDLKKQQLQNKLDDIELKKIFIQLDSFTTKAEVDNLELTLPDRIKNKDTYILYRDYTLKRILNDKVEKAIDEIQSSDLSTSISIFNNLEDEVKQNPIFIDRYSAYISKSTVDETLHFISNAPYDDILDFEKTLVLKNIINPLTNSLGLNVDANILSSIPYIEAKNQRKKELITDRISDINDFVSSCHTIDEISFLETKLTSPIDLEVLSDKRYLDNKINAVKKLENLAIEKAIVDIMQFDDVNLLDNFVSTLDGFVVFSPRFIDALAKVKNRLANAITKDSLKNLFKQTRPRLGDIVPNLNKVYNTPNKNYFSKGWIKVKDIRDKYFRNEIGEIVHADKDFLGKSGFLSYKSSDSSIGGNNFLGNDGYLHSRHLPDNYELSYEVGRVLSERGPYYNEKFVEFDFSAGDPQHPPLLIKDKYYEHTTNGEIKLMPSTDPNAKTFYFSSYDFSLNPLDLNNGVRQFTLHSAIQQSYANFDIYIGSQSNISDDPNTLPTVEQIEDEIFNNMFSATPTQSTPANNQPTKTAQQYMDELKAKVNDGTYGFVEREIWKPLYADIKKLPPSIINDPIFANVKTAIFSQPDVKHIYDYLKTHHQAIAGDILINDFYNSLDKYIAYIEDQWYDSNNQSAKDELVSFGFSFAKNPQQYMDEFILKFDNGTYNQTVSDLALGSSGANMIFHYDSDHSAYKRISDEIKAIPQSVMDSPLFADVKAFFSKPTLRESIEYAKAQNSSITSLVGRLTKVAEDLIQALRDGLTGNLPSSVKLIYGSMLNGFGYTV